MDAVIFMVPSVTNKNANKPNDKFYLNNTNNILLYWDAITWKNVCQWWKTLHKWAGNDVRVSSHWAPLFFYKPATLELCERVDSQYNNLPASFKGGVTYIFLILKILFHMHCDTITDLKKYLKIFKEKDCMEFVARM